MTAGTLTKTALSAVKADAILGGGVSGRSGPPPPPGVTDVDKAFKKQLLAALKTMGATGRTGDVVTLATLGRTTAPTLVAVGLGDEQGKGGQYDAEAIRRAVG